LHNIPPFTFANLPDTERLTYEMLDKLNYPEVYEMFKEDNNPFIIEEYKQLDKLERYVDSLLNYAKKSTKRGGCDWLVKHKQTQSHRRKHFTFEAVNNLIKYVINHFGMELIIADTSKQNEISKKFLRKLGFIDVKDKYDYSDKFDYFEFTLDIKKSSAHIL